MKKLILLTIFGGIFQLLLPAPEASARRLVDAMEDAEKRLEETDPIKKKPSGDAESQLQGAKQIGSQKVQAPEVEIKPVKVKQKPQVGNLEESTSAKKQQSDQANVKPSQGQKLDIQQLMPLLAMLSGMGSGGAGGGGCTPSSGAGGGSLGTFNGMVQGCNEIAVGSDGSVNQDQLRNHIFKQVSASGLNGLRPRDGAKYGIDGSPQSWTNYFMRLAEKESSYKTTTVGDQGKFAGNSNGIFQLSPADATNHGLQGSEFSMDQLRDPCTNTNAALAITEKLVKQDGVIAGNSNGRWQGASRYWGPLRRGVV